MDVVSEQHVEVPLGDVRAGVADLVGAPAAFERAEDLARRARIDPDGVRRTGRAETPEHLEDLGEWVGLEREPEAERDAGTGQRVLQPARVLGVPGAVIHEQRRAVPPRQRLGVLPTDRQTPVTRLEAGPPPPRGRGRTTRAAAGSAPVTRCAGGRGLEASELVADPLRRGPRWTRACGRDASGDLDDRGLERLALRTDGLAYPLILRTNWRAAASSSPVVVGASARRRVLMLRHIQGGYTTSAHSSRDGPGPPFHQGRRIPLVGVAIFLGLALAVRQTTAWGAGHDVQIDRPDLVVAATRRSSRPPADAYARHDGPIPDDHRAVPHPLRRADPASRRATSARRRSRRPASTCSRSTPRTCSSTC